MVSAAKQHNERGQKHAFIWCINYGGSVMPNVML